MKHTLKKRLPLILIAICAIMGLVLFGDQLTLENLRNNREYLQNWRTDNPVLSALAYIIVYALAVAISLPGGLVMTLTGGFLFGTMLGAAYTVIGATLGAVGIFLAARTGLGDVLRTKTGQWLEKFQKGIRENEVSFLLLIRLVPIVPFFVANVAPAFLGVRTRTYIWTTALGIIPGTVVFSSVGAGLGEVFDRGDTPKLDIIFEPPALLPILGLCLLAALPMILKAIRGKTI
jgi:uncharacterized membrane protein YdjX (TVP38/TMEM64 family)